MHAHMLTAQAIIAFTVSSGAVKADKNDQCSNIRNSDSFCPLKMAQLLLGYLLPSLHDSTVQLSLMRLFYI